MRQFAFAVLWAATLLGTACETETSQVCTTELRTAITGILTDDSGALVKPQSVTAHVNGGEASAYEVSVTSNGKTTTNEVTVSADECHVTQAVRLNFEISGEPGLGGLNCPDRRWLLAEIDLNGWSYQQVDDPRFLVPLPVMDGKVRVYAPPGLAEVDQAIAIRVNGGVSCDPGFETVATVTFVPQSNGCGYQVVSMQLTEEDIDYCRQL